jgi:hypothetical protein
MSCCARCRAASLALPSRASRWCAPSRVKWRSRNQRSSAAPSPSGSVARHRASAPAGAANPPRRRARRQIGGQRGLQRAALARVDAVGLDIDHRFGPFAARPGGSAVSRPRRRGVTDSTGWSRRWISMPCAAIVAAIESTRKGMSSLTIARRMRRCTPSPPCDSMRDSGRAGASAVPRRSSRRHAPRA